MKKLFFLFTFFAAVAVSCTRDDVRGGVAPVSEGEPVTLRVGVSTLGTRADGETIVDSSNSTVVSSDPEKKINSLQVLVFSHETGGLERSAYDSIGVGYVEMTCFAGLKDVIAVVNAPEEINWLELSTLEDFNNNLKTRLDENEEYNFFMYGSVVANVAAEEYVEIEVTRRVARVVLNSVTNHVAYNGVVGELYLNDVYLVNVAGICDYGCSEDYVPDLWHNQSYKESGLPSNLSGFLCGGFDVDGPLDSGGSYNERQVFYCYPNFTEEDSDSEVFSPRRTRLVVEATLNGNRWYYPITLDKVEPNCTYEIDLIIEGAGADSPDSEPRGRSYTFTVTVADWIYDGFEEKI